MEIQFTRADQLPTCRTGRIFLAQNLFRIRGVAKWKGLTGWRDERKLNEFLKFRSKLSNWSFIDKAKSAKERERERVREPVPIPKGERTADQEIAEDRISSAEASKLLEGVIRPKEPIFSLTTNLPPCPDGAAGFMCQGKRQERDANMSRQHGTHTFQWRCWRRVGPVKSR